MNSGKGSTAVGTATIATDGTFTLTSHGLADGDTVTVDTLTGGAVGVLVADAVYFVRDVSGDDFALSLTLHGPVVTFGSTGGADVYTWAPGYDAQELRRAGAVLWYPDSADEFAGRSGVRPHSQVPVSVAGTTWTVHDLTAVVMAAGSGPYVVAHAEESGSLDPADGSSPRIDALDLQIQDDSEDASGQRRARVVYVAGTPAGSPSAPAVTTNALRLGTVLVPAGGSPAPSVATLAQWTVASGAILPVRAVAELSTGGLYDGLFAWDQAVQQLLARTGGSWQHLASPGGWRHIGAAQETANFTIDLTAAGRFPAGTFRLIRVHFRGSITVDDVNLNCRVNSDSTAGLHERGFTVGSLADGAVAATGSSDATSWLLARWSTFAANNATITIYDTHLDTTISFQSTGIRVSSTDSAQQISEAGGRLNDSRLIDSLQVFPTSGAVSSLRWTAEGYLA
jgi:hypothetical protein